MWVINKLNLRIKTSRLKNSEQNVITGKFFLEILTKNLDQIQYFKCINNWYIIILSTTSESSTTSSELLNKKILKK
jgi:hypothetical protein